LFKAGTAPASHTQQGACQFGNIVVNQRFRGKRVARQAQRGPLCCAAA
jgi:hypothetical protein